jgi:LCP family protein required for cell wall assembly
MQHKKFKGQNSSQGSIDGMVPSSGRLGVPSRSAYQPNRGQSTPSLGNFVGRTDGFYPVSQSPQSLGGSPEEAETEALLDEPILLDVEPTDKRRHYFGHKRPRLRRVIKRAALSLAVLVLIAGAYLGVKFYITEQNLFRGGGRAPALAENVDINQLKGEGDGRVNILLLGIGGPGHDGGDLTDTILLASIDPVNHKAALLSIPRDLWVHIPGDGSQKVNAAYVYGKQQSKAKTLAAKEEDGLSLLDRTLQPVLGIPIHYHAVVDFAAFKQTVDALGGVTFNVPETLYDPTIAWENHYNPVIARKGTQSFNGQLALLYAKSRETSSDFARGQRQRQVLIAIKDKVLSVGTFSNPLKISQLLDSLGNNVYTDFNSGEFKRIYQVISKTPSSSITSIDLVTPPHNLVTTANIGGLSTVVPEAGTFDYDAIKNYVRNALRDGFLAKENATVAVYNATNVAGLAASQADVLKSYGYNVTAVANAPQATNPPTSTLVDLSKGVNKYSRHYLQARFGVTAKSSLPAGSGITPPAGTAFVIILGGDAATTNSR